jgi:phosphatidylinositol alpha-1,6-mannosyltransferase
VRLLFVAHSLPPEGRPMENVGGMQRVAIDLHDALRVADGHDVRMLVLRSSWNERGYRTPLFLATALREIRRMARAQQIDAILFSSMVTASLAVPLEKLLRRNKIATASIVNGLDATTPTWPYPLLVRRVFQSLDLVMPISEATADACRARGLNLSQCNVVPLGIRADRFAAQIDRATARQRILPAAANPRLILCTVGRLVPRKGVAWFVDNVMPLLPADVVYLIAGEGPERPRIEAVIARRNLRDRVQLLGAISDERLAALYHGADLFVMPNVRVANDMEGFGLVLLEAGLCGLPAIASDLEGIRDVITDGENGSLVRSGDAEEFRDRILSWYDDPSALRMASERARAHTIDRFSWDDVVNRYLTIIDGLLSR